MNIVWSPSTIKAHFAITIMLNVEINAVQNPLKNRLIETINYLLIDCAQFK